MKLAEFQYKIDIYPVKRKIEKRYIGPCFPIHNSRITIHESHGTLLVADHDRAFCRWVDRYRCAVFAGNGNHSGRSDHSPYHAWPGEKYRLAGHLHSCPPYTRNVCARFSERLLWRQVLRSDQMGNARRHSWRTHRHLFRNHRLVCWTGDWRDPGRIRCRQKNDRRWPGRLGEFVGKSRRNDRQIDDRAGDDHDLLYDGAAAILSSSTELTECSEFSSNHFVHSV